MYIPFRSEASRGGRKDGLLLPRFPGTGPDRNACGGREVRTAAAPCPAGARPACPEPRGWSSARIERGCGGKGSPSRVPTARPSRPVRRSAGEAPVVCFALRRTGAPLAPSRGVADPFAGQGARAPLPCPGAGKGRPHSHRPPPFVLVQVSSSQSPSGIETNAFLCKVPHSGDRLSGEQQSRRSGASSPSMEFGMRGLCLMLLSILIAGSAQAARIHDAAKSGDIAGLSAAIAAGDDVNAREGNLTPLYLAIQGGHIEAVRLLLKGDADPDQPAGFGYPLAAAITAGRSDIVEVLLKEGANPNIERQSITALHKAAESGCFECVALLVNAGANVNARTTQHTTVIHLAKRNGHQRIVDYLMTHGVSVAVPASILPLLAKADAGHGKSIFDKTCAGCHQINPQFPSRDGPLLRGIVGRKRAAVDKYKYSEAMRELGGTWGYDEIGSFIADPTGIVPGTGMMVVPVWEATDQDRADVVLYLRSLSDNPAPMP